MKTPTIQRESSVPAKNFLITFRRWTGRLLTTCANLSFHLYELIRKTKRTTQPIFEKSNVEEKPFQERRVEKEQSSSNKDKVPSPLAKKTGQIPPIDSHQNGPVNKKETDIILDEDKADIRKDSEVKKDQNLKKSIMTSLFDNLGLDLSHEDLLIRGIFFDEQKKEQKVVDLTGTNGFFQVEWDLSHLESKAAFLIYRGNFERGTFSGRGTFFTQDKDGVLHLLLEGQFENNKFISGRLVMDNCFIEGTFINGEKSGNGTIYFLPTNSTDKTIENESDEDIEDDNDHDEGVHNVNQILEYRGEFVDGVPHGKGKLYVLASEGVQIVGDGEFKNGNPSKGIFHDFDGNILEGEFKDTQDNYFKGKVIDLKNGILYTGEVQKGKYHGQGKLEYALKCSYNEIETLDDHEEAVLRKIDTQVTITKTGLFRNGAFHKGEQKILWKNGQWGHINTENEMFVSSIYAKGGYTYKGRFNFGIDGEGTIYNSEGAEVYTGSISCGYPHGKGRKQERNGTITEGNFKWGVLETTKTSII
jgi:hypothetical protein